MHLQLQTEVRKNFFNMNFRINARNMNKRLLSSVYSYIVRAYNKPLANVHFGVLCVLSPVTENINVMRATHSLSFGWCSSLINNYEI